MSFLSTIKIRRADNDDNRDFNGLLTSLGGQTLFRAWFGLFNFQNLIEFSSLSLICHVGETECAAFLSLNDSMNNNDLYTYEICLNLLKKTLNCKATNTLFINLLALDHKLPQSVEIGRAILRHAFINYSELEYIIWCCPVSAKAPDFVLEVFNEMSVTTDDEESNRTNILRAYKVYFVHRTKIVPQLLVREALVEDNDDLLPILRNNSVIHSEDIQDDDYFLANLIESRNPSNRYFVCINERLRPAGLLATSLDVNIDLINKVFDVEESFSDIIIQTGEKPPVRCILALVIGYPHLLEAAHVSEIAFESGFAQIDVEELLESQTAPLSPPEIITLIKSEIQRLAATAEDTETRIQNIVLHNFPRTEAEAVALLQSEVAIDTVVEVVPGSEDADIDDEDIADDLLDAMECLRNQLGPRDEAYEAAVDGEAPTVARAMWKRIALDESQEVEVNEVLASELRDAFDTLMRITFQQREGKILSNSANAFVVTIFCIDQSLASRSEDLLRMAFEEHEALDYCLLMLPNTAPPTPLTRWMFAVKPRSGVSYDQTLYVLHRDTLLASGSLLVSRLTSLHKDDVERFLDPLGEDGAGPMAAFQSSLRDSDAVEMRDNPEEISFAVSLEKEMVGLVVVSRQYTTPDDITWIRANYLLEDIVMVDKHKNRAHAMITHWVLNPIYSCWSRHVLREVMRMYQKSLLFFQSSKTSPPPVDIARELIPIRPRPRLQAKVKDEEPFVQRPTSYADGRASPLFVMAKRFVSEHKRVIGTRVVVVGGGSSTFSLFDALCFVPNIYFSNLFLVLERAPDPWVATSSAGSERPEMSNSGSVLGGVLSPTISDEPMMQEIWALGLANRVTLVRGRIRDIDRENQAIVLWNNVALEYDILVLSSGIHDATSRSIASFNKLHPRQCMEYGLFSLGHAEMEAMALKWLKRRSRPETAVESDDIIVYGSGVRAIVAIEKLLQKGIEADRIAWVIPADQAVELGHDALDEAAQNCLDGCHVNIILASEIVDIGRSASGYVQSVTIRPISNSDFGNEDEAEDGTTGEEIPCCAVLAANRFLCDYDVFAAVNDSGLVYDGGVVVDKNFRTVDPHIYAVGDFTRFSRIHKFAPLHDSYSPRELGAYVGRCILQRDLLPSEFNSTFIKKKQSNDDLRNGDDNPYALPILNQPRSMSALIPGGLHFVSIVLPGIHKELSAYVTGDSSSEALCVLQIDPLGVVVELSCLSTTAVQDRNLSCAVGLHEGYLNSAIFAYETGHVMDWIEFLNRDWMTAVCHDKFPSFTSELREMLALDPGTEALTAAVLDITETTEEDGVIAGERRRLLGDRGGYISDGTRKLVETQTVEFLKRNKILLNKFQIPVPNSSKQSKK